MAGRVGRPVSTKVYFRILLRLPPDLQAQVEQCHALLQRHHGPKFTQSQALWHLLEAGCTAVMTGRGDSPTPAPRQKPISEISEISPSRISKISEISGEDLSVPGYGFPEDADERPTPASPAPATATPAPQLAPPRATGETMTELPADIVKIADARAQYDKISEREFTKLLFERGIYRHRAKDGREVPIPHTTLRLWLQRAREAGVL